MEKLNLNEQAKVTVVRPGTPSDDNLNLRGKFLVEHVRNGQVIGRYNVRNTITTEGKSSLLDVMFHGVAAMSPWYIGLIDNDGVTPPVAGNTYAQIGGTNGWDEFTTYTGDRKEWTEGAASAGVITNAVAVTFDITGTATVYGLFVAGGTTADTKEDVTAGCVLWAATAFSGGTVPVGNGDQLKVTYTVSS